MKQDQENTTSEKEIEANENISNNATKKKKMGYYKKSIIFYSILFGLVIIGYWGVQQYINGLCGTEKITEELSPDKQLKAVVYNYGCGADSATSTHISIVDRDKVTINESGNVFISQGNSDGVWVKWMDNETLKINANRETVFRELDKFKDIQILYVGKNNPTEIIETK